MSPSRRRATYEDVRALPDHVVGELIDGELLVSPRPAPRHSLATSALMGHLMPMFQWGNGGPGGWWILFEPELHLGEDVVVPDVAGWRKERMAMVPDSPAIELPPDWLCEVVSPSTARIDRTLKLRLYARVGVPHVWILDPLARTLEVLGLSETRYLILSTHAGDERVRAQPFDAVELEMAAWWAGPESV